MCLLQKCEQNLQIAVNMYLENPSSCTDSTQYSNSCMSMEVDDVEDIDSSPQVPVIKTSSQCCNLEGETVASTSGKYIQYAWDSIFFTNFNYASQGCYSYILIIIVI